MYKLYKYYIYTHNINICIYIYIFITSLYILVLGISHFYAIFIPGRPDCGIPRPRLSVRRRARRGSAATSRQRRPAIGNNLIFLQLSSSFNRGSPHLAGWVRKRKIPAIKWMRTGGTTYFRKPPSDFQWISDGFPMVFFCVMFMLLSLYRASFQRCKYIQINLLLVQSS